MDYSVVLIIAIFRC